MSDPLGLHITVPGSHGGPAFAALTPNATRGVVVIHEIFGPQPEIERVVLRFASLGYAVVAPDLFHQGTKLGCIRRAMMSIQSGDGPMIDQIRASRQWLCEQTGLKPERVAIIGFCMGGGFALAAGGGWGAVSSNYGDVPPAAVMRDLAPVVACYGGRDVPFRNKGELLKKRLAEVGKTPEVHNFPEAGHAFLTDGDHPIASAIFKPLLHVEYNAAVAERGWEKILGFFDRELPA